MSNKDLVSVLIEEIDREILSKMPVWFKVLRKAYQDRKIRMKQFYSTP
jgi:hypothetical protein